MHARTTLGLLDCFIQIWNRNNNLYCNTNCEILSFMWFLNTNPENISCHSYLSLDHITCVFVHLNSAKCPEVKTGSSFLACAWFYLFLYLAFAKLFDSKLHPRWIIFKTSTNHLRANDRNQTSLISLRQLASIVINFRMMLSVRNLSKYETTICISLSQQKRLIPARNSWCAWNICVLEVKTNLKFRLWRMKYACMHTNILHT